MVRHAFSMIELIFAIVLIAIVVVAVPQMMTQNAKLVEGNRAQEGVFLASAAAVRLLSYRWDANSKDINVTSNLDYSKVLDINQTPATTERKSITVDGETILLPLRVGHIPQDRHRRFHSQYTPPAASGLFGASITLNDTAIGADAFKFGYTLDITGGYSAPFAPTGSGISDTKMATITIKNNDTGVDDVIMRIYAFNIGEIDYAKRTFQ